MLQPIQLTADAEAQILAINRIIGYKSTSYQVLSSGILHCHYSPVNRKSRKPLTIQIERKPVGLVMTITARGHDYTFHPYQTPADCLRIAADWTRINPELI